KLARAVLEVAFRCRDRASAMHDAAFRANQTGVLAQGPHKIEFQLQRRPGVALGDRRKYRAAERRIEKGCRKSAVHGSDRVVMTKVRQAFKDRTPVFYLGQMKAHQLADRRIGQFAGDDRLEKRKAVVRFQNLRRDDAISLRALVHAVPRVGYSDLIASLRAGNSMRW